MALTFYQWECPECCHVSDIEDAHIQGFGFSGVVKCAGCSKAFKLAGLYANGFVFESEDKEQGGN